jgi:hypothetical protein
MINIGSAALAPLPLASLQQMAGNYELGLMLMASLPILCGVLTLTIRSRSNTIITAPNAARHRVE